MRHDELIVLERILGSMHKMQQPPEPLQLQKTLERVSAFLGDSQRPRRPSAAAGVSGEAEREREGVEEAEAEEAGLARSSTIANRHDDSAKYAELDNLETPQQMRAAAAPSTYANAHQRATVQEQQFSSGGACMVHLQKMISALKKGGHCCSDMTDAAATSCPSCRLSIKPIKDPCCLDFYMRTSLVRISMVDGRRAANLSGSDVMITNDVHKVSEPSVRVRNEKHFLDARLKFRGIIASPFPRFCPYGFKNGTRAADIIITPKDTDSLLEVMRLWGLDRVWDNKLFLRKVTMMLVLLLVLMLMLLLVLTLLLSPQLMYQLRLAMRTEDLMNIRGRDHQHFDAVSAGFRKVAGLPQHRADHKGLHSVSNIMAVLMTSGDCRELAALMLAFFAARQSLQVNRKLLEAHSLQRSLLEGGRHCSGRVRGSSSAFDDERRAFSDIVVRAVPAMLRTQLRAANVKIFAPVQMVESYKPVLKSESGAEDNESGRHVLS